MTRKTMTLQKDELNPLKDKSWIPLRIGVFILNIINEGLCQLKKSETTRFLDQQG